MAAATRKARVAELLEGVAADVARLPEPVLRQFAPVLAEAHRELERDLRKWLRTVPDGGERFTALKYRQAMLQLDAAMKTLRTKVPAELLDKLSARAPKLSESAKGNMIDLIVGTQKALGAEPIAIPIFQAAHVNQAMAARIYQHKRSIDRYGAQMTFDIRRQLAVGLVRHETFDEMTARLVRLRARSGPFGQRQGDIPYNLTDRARGIASAFHIRHHGWAQRLVRTEVLETYNNLFEKNLDELQKADPGWQKRWDATLDGRVCPACRALDGQPRELNESFLPGVQRPPLHPNCRCGITPWRQEWTDELGTVTAAPPAAPPAPAEPPKEAQPATPFESVIAKLGELRFGELRPTSNWDAARPLLEKELEPYKLGRTDLPRGIASDNGKGRLRVEELPKALGVHKWSGEIAIAPEQARSAARFAKAWEADAQKVRREMADAVKASEEAKAARDILDKQLNAAVQVQQKAFAALNRDQQRDLLDWHWKGVGPLPASLSSDADQKTALEWRAAHDQVRDLDRKRAQLGSQATSHLYESSAMSTLVHEAIHGYGSHTSAAYFHAGIPTEEMATEVLARKHMRDHYGVPDSYIARTGAYSKWIDPMVDHVAELYGVDKSAARTILEEAALAFKRKNVLAYSPDDLIDDFVTSFRPTGNPALDTPRSSLVTQVRGEYKEWTGAQSRLERKIRELPRDP